MTKNDKQALSVLLKLISFIYLIKILIEAIFLPSWITLDKIALTIIAVGMLIDNFEGNDEK
jgi:hypothetical protein